MRRKGNLRGFHNYSTNRSSILIDGVTVEDLLSIIRKSLKDSNYEKWKTLIDDLYKHIVNYNNPHEFTVSQLDETIVDVLYRQWINEGYTGSKEDFLEVFFQYVDVVDLPDMDLVLAGQVDDKIPVIAVLAEYVRLHDVSLDAHAEQFANLFGNIDVEFEIPTPPVFVVSRIANLGLPRHHDYSDGISLIDYPMKNIETKTGFFIFEYIRNNIVGYDKNFVNFKLGQFRFDQPTFKTIFKWEVAGAGWDQAGYGYSDDPDTNSSSRFSRYISMKLNNNGIEIVHTYPDVDLSTLEKTEVFNYDKIESKFHVGLKFNIDNTYTLVLENTAHPFGAPYVSDVNLNSLMTIMNITTNYRAAMNEHLTNRCIYYSGEYSIPQIRHTMKSLWSKP